MARHLSGRRRKNHRDLLATRGPEEWRGCRRGGQVRAPRLAPPSRRRLRGTDGGGRPPPRGISSGRAPEAASRARAPLSAAEPSTAASSAGLHVLPGGVERSGAERHETLTRKYPPLARARPREGGILACQGLVTLRPTPLHSTPGSTWSPALLAAVLGSAADREARAREAASGARPAEMPRGGGRPPPSVPRSLRREGGARRGARTWPPRRQPRHSSGPRVARRSR